MKWFVKMNKSLFLGFLILQSSMAVFSDDGDPDSVENTFNASSKSAKFDVLSSTLSKLSVPTGQVNPTLLGYYHYLQNHILPTVNRLASVCSYQAGSLRNISDKGLGLIQMNGTNVGTITPYDQGVIVAIQNNTGDQLKINQITSASSGGNAASNPVGFLNASSTLNHFLHTASLMTPSMTAGVQDPVSGNMIEIKDATVGASAYVQVVSGTQLGNLVANLNQALTEVYSTDYNFAYNQKNGASAGYTPTGKYFLITNFNTSSPSASSSAVLMYRMQAVDISQFDGQPFAVTLQINNESSMLYPSVVSIKRLWLLNNYNLKYDAQNPGVTTYNYIPPLLISDDILNGTFKVPGIKNSYNTWLFNYVYALQRNYDQITENLLNISDSNNMFSVFNKPIGLFDLYIQQPPSRVVIDVSGNLPSGAVQNFLKSSLVADYKNYSVNQLTPVTSTANQAQAMYLSLMGSDVIDIGSDYHQDIPILNLYSNGKDSSGNNIVVGNKSGGDWINLSVTFGRPSQLPNAPTLFPKGYGVPYSNVMLFSLPTSDMKKGVIGELSQTSAGNYELKFKKILSDQQLQVLQQKKVKELMQNDSQLTQTAALQQAQSLDYGLLGVQKVFLDTSMIENLGLLVIQFLNSTDPGWNSTTSIPYDSVVHPLTIAISKGDTTQMKTFKLTYGASGNTLTAVEYKKPTAQKKSTTSPVTTPVTTPVTSSTKISSAVSPATTSVTSLAASPVTTAAASIVTSQVQTGLPVTKTTSVKKITTSSVVTSPATTPVTKTTAVQIADTLSVPSGQDIEGLWLYLLPSAGLPYYSFGFIDIKNLQALNVALSNGKILNASISEKPTNVVLTFNDNVTEELIAKITIPNASTSSGTGYVLGYAVGTKKGFVKFATWDQSIKIIPGIKNQIKQPIINSMKNSLTSPVNSPATVSGADDGINELTEQITSLNTKVKEALDSATDSYEQRLLNSLDKKVSSLLSKVTPNTTAKDLKNMQKQYQKLKDNFMYIVAPE